MRLTNSESIVHGGCERARSATKARIRAEVADEFNDRLQSAGWFRALFVRVAMYREIKRRLDSKSPRDALYIFCG